jgi:hypothetical protein
MQNQENKKQKRLSKSKVLIASLIVVFIIIVIIFCFAVLRPKPVITPLPAPQTEQVKEKYFANFININNFSTNPSVSQVGFVLRLRDNLINTNDHSNCKINIIPPPQNGCYLRLQPYNKMFSEDSTWIKSIKIKGVITENAKILIYSQPPDFHQTDQPILVIDKESINKTILIKSVPKTGLWFSLWANQGNINIENLKFNVSTGSQIVNLPIDSISSPNPKIFNDVDENGLFDPLIDINVDKDSKAPIIVETKTENNQTKFETTFQQNPLQKTPGIPTGKWFLEINNSIYKLEVELDSKNFKLEKI